jgi:hypothetical protein
LTGLRDEFLTPKDPECGLDRCGCRRRAGDTPRRRRGGDIATIAKTNNRLYRAYLLKGQLRAVFATRGKAGTSLLAGGISWADHCHIPEFGNLTKTIRKYLPLIRNGIDHGLSNARSESTDTHFRVLTRRAYGFRWPEALITMAMPTRSGLGPPSRTVLKGLTKPPALTAVGPLWTDAMHHDHALSPEHRSPQITTIGGLLEPHTVAVTEALLAGSEG